MKDYLMQDYLMRHYLMRHYLMRHYSVIWLFKGNFFVFQSKSHPQNFSGFSQKNFDTPRIYSGISQKNFDTPSFAFFLFFVKNSEIVKKKLRPPKKIEIANFLFGYP